MTLKLGVDNEDIAAEGLIYKPENTYKCDLISTQLCSNTNQYNRYDDEEATVIANNYTSGKVDAGTTETADESNDYLLSSDEECCQPYRVGKNQPIENLTRQVTSTYQKQTV